MRLAAGIASAVLLLFITLIAAITATLTALFGSSNASEPSAEVVAVADIPDDYLALYQ